MMRRLAFALSCLLVICSLALAQTNFHLPKIEPFGIDGFRLMLQQKGLETVQVRLSSAMRAPEDTVIVLIGDLREAQRIINGLSQFVRNGGALLVATDLGGPASRGTKRLRWLFQTEIRNGRMAFARSGRLDSRYSDCPLVTDIRRTSEPELFAGVQSIAANRPGYLKPSDDVRGVAWLPRTIHQNQDPVPLIGSCQIGKGRMLLVADHSVFINEMLIHADNARFASNVADWLTADGNRKHVVVCLNNGLLPEWSFAGTPPTIPLKHLLKSVERYGLAGLPMGEALLPTLNRSLVDFERQDGFNSLVRNKLAGPSWRRGSPNLQKPLIVVAALVLFAAARWLIVTRASTQRWYFFQADAPLGGSRVAAAVSEQQPLPVLRTLIREFFAEAGVTRFSEPENYPSVQLQGSVRARKAKSAGVRALWDVATAASLGQMSSKRIDRLTEQLRDLYGLHAQGVLKLQ